MRKLLTEEEQYVSSGNKDGHKLETGINKFRFYPAHKGEPSFFKMYGSHWGKIDGDGGEPVSRKVPDGKMHGGLSADPIEAYILLCQQTLDGADEVDVKKLAALTNNKSGLQCKIKWAAWADKLVDGKPVFDLFEFTKTVREAIRKESIIDDAEEAIEVDPFTDPDDGKMMIIDYNGAAKKANQYYKGIRLAKAPTPLTDEQVEHFVTKVKPLSQLTQFTYTEKNFETALEIVKYFDETEEVNLFDSDEYQEIIAKLRKEMKKNAGGAATTSVKAAKKATPADDDDEDEAPKPKKKPAVADDDDDVKPVAKAKAKPVEVEEEEEEPVVAKKKKKADKFTEMDRMELREYIAENELEIVVKKVWTDDELRDKIREFEAGTEEEDVPIVNTKKAKPVEDDDDDAPAPAKKKPNLAGIKDRLRGE
jgi:hypothetical protein